MKLIKTFMAAALLSTAIAGSVMADDIDLGGIKLPRAVKVAELNTAIGAIKDGDTATLTVTFKPEFAKALFFCKGF